MFEVKNTHLHTSYAPESQILVRLALQWAVFKLRPNVEKKNTPNDPIMTFTFHIRPRSPKFSPVSLCDEPFSNGPILKKRMLWMPHRCPWHIRGQKYLYAYLICPRFPKLGLFALQWTILKLWPKFWEKYTEWPNKRPEVLTFCLTFLPDEINIR